MRPRIDIPASKIPTVQDIAFTAGFYEGEGYVTDDTKNGGFLVQIGTNNLEILEWLQERYGGKVYGKETEYKNAIGNRTYYWKIRRERAIGFMWTIYKFLSVERREQFKLALEGKSTGRTYKKATKFPSDIQKLLKRITIKR